MFRIETESVCLLPDASVFVKAIKTMLSILAGVYKATLGLLVDKVRDKTAEKLKYSDVVDQTFYDLIVREIDDIKTKLDGLARKDLLASIEYFKTGIVNLNKVFEKSIADRSRYEETATIAVKSSLTKGLGEDVNVTGDTDQVVSRLVIKRIEDLQVTDLNESARQSLIDASKRFEAARLEATRAFCNEAMKTSDRILALKIQLMATILERLDRPSDVLDECRICLENLHSMQAVRENFKVHLTGGLKSWMNKKEREAIIIDVCQVNHVVFRVAQVVNGGKVDNNSLPCIKVGSESVDISCNRRITKTLRELGMVQFCRCFWSFGQDGRPGENLSLARHVVTNTKGQFVVAGDGFFDNLKVYSGGGIFEYSICYSHEPLSYFPWGISLWAVATDRDDNVYVLCEQGQKNGRMWIKVFDQHGKRRRQFPLSDGFKGYSVTVNDNYQVFVIGKQNQSYHEVGVFEADGEFVRNFGKETLKFPRDIASIENGLVLVLDAARPACVKTFNAQGEVQQQFTLQDFSSDFKEGTIVYNVDNQTVVVVVSFWRYKGSDSEKDRLLIYKDGSLVRDVRRLDDGTTLDRIQGAAVTADGRIAVMLFDVTSETSRICVMQKEDYFL